MSTAPTPHPPPTLVGRERELAVIRHSLDAAFAGKGSLVLISGEAGIGKTTLAESVCREAADAGALVLVGRCYDLTETPPYGPWVELFGQYIQSDTLPLPDAFARHGAVGEVTSQAVLFQQVLDFFTALAAEHPLLLLLDDFHWADPASLDLLRFLARSLSDLPIVILVTYRSDELTRRHPLYQLLPTLVRESSADRLDLHALDRAAIRTLVATRYPLPDAEAERLTTYLHARTEGNALFVGELLRTLMEEGVLLQTDGGWQLGELARIAVPLLLRQVIDGRVGRLDDEAQRLLAVAAVIGQEVPFALWAAVAECDEDAVLAVVEQVMEARLLVESVGADGVRFAHALIREAVYAGLSPLRRRQLHRRVAEVLAATHSPDPDAVAYHFQQVGDPRAVPWLIAAGDRAQDAYAWPTAATRFEAALSMIEAGDEDAGQRGWLLYRIARLLRNTEPDASIAYLDEASRFAAATGDDALAAGVAFTRGVCQCLVGDYENGLPELTAGVAAVEALSPDARARLNAHSDIGDFAFVRGTLVLHLAIAGRFREAMAVGEHFLAQFPVLEQGHARWGAAYVHGIEALDLTCIQLGKVEEAWQLNARAMTLHRERGNYSQLATGMTETIRHLLVQYATERIAERHAQAVEASRMWCRVGGFTDDLAAYVAVVPYLRLEGRWHELNTDLVRGLKGSVVFEWVPIEQAIIAREQGEAERAWDTIRQKLPDGPRTPFGAGNYFLGVPLVQLAAALACDADDLAAARAWLEMHDRWFAASGAVLLHAEGEALWARYHRQAGDPDQARTHAEAALAHATEPRQPLALLIAHRLLGELDTDAGAHDVAQTHLDIALALATACKAPYECALTLIVLADLRAATDASEDARALLDAAHAICAPLDARLALARIAAIQTRLAAPPVAPTWPAGLSVREVEVLRLVAQGLTDAEVAQRLFLSPRTVGQHLRSVYNKLGVSSRTAATRFAVEHGLS
jgi:ATP/maltotriose-dependent transcriptional regulator MalT